MKKQLFLLPVAAFLTIQAPSIAAPKMTAPMAASTTCTIDSSKGTSPIGMRNALTLKQIDADTSSPTTASRPTQAPSQATAEPQSQPLGPSFCIAPRSPLPAKSSLPMPLSTPNSSASNPKKDSKPSMNFSPARTAAQPQLHHHQQQQSRSPNSPTAPIAIGAENRILPIVK